MDLKLSAIEGLTYYTGQAFPKWGAKMLPEAAAAVRKLEAEQGPLRYTDIFRTADISLHAYATKAGTQPPGYSAHNFGLSIDFDTDGTMKAKGWTYKQMCDVLGQYGFYCHRRDGVAGSGKSECVSADTLINTSRGLIRVDQVKAGDIVDTLYGSRKVLASIVKGVRKTFKLDTSIGGSIRATEEHPFLVVKPDLTQKYVKLCDLEVGDWLVVKSGSLDKKEPSLMAAWKEAKKLVGHNNTQDHKLPEQMTPTLALFMGYLTSEGYIGKDRIGFYNIDQKFMNEYCSALESEFEIHREPIVRTEVCFGSLLVNKYLSEIGLTPDRSATKRVPWSIFEASHESRLAYIRGCFNGDGTIRPKHAYINIASISKGLILDLQRLLLSIGYVSRVRQERGGSDWIWKVLITGPEAQRLAKALGYGEYADSWKLSNKRQNPNRHEVIPYFRDLLKNIRVSKKRPGVKGTYECSDGINRLLSFRCWTANGDPHYPTSTYWMKNKVKEVLPDLKLLDPIMYDRVINLLDPSLTTVQIRSIESCEPEPVWDLSVEVKNDTEEPHFIANGLVVHNCWHFNYFPPELKDQLLALAKSENSNTWAAPVEARIQQLYGDQFQYGVKQAQEYLAILKMYNATVDGLQGPITRQSIAVFQRAWKLPDTGALDLKTQRTLALISSNIILV